MQRREARGSAMATVEDVVTVPDTVADLLDQLGGIAPERVLLKPAPGTATIQDVVASLETPRKRLCELIDGVLVEKAMGIQESQLAGFLIQILLNYLDQHPLGIVVAPDGFFRLAPQIARAPDVSFISWDRLPEGKLPAEPIPDLAPDLAIEVLSIGNTKGEMARKIADLFQAGTREVWLIQPKTQTAEVYTSPTDKRKVAKSGTLEGGTVVPGFRLALSDLFKRAFRKRGS
jgi:Uma2 family endonuclease